MIQNKENYEITGMATPTAKKKAPERTTPKMKEASKWTILPRKKTCEL